MADARQPAAVRGKTIRFAWTEGPTKGMTHEHVFHQDGTVEWHDAMGDEKARRPAGERPKYAAIRVADDVYLVSYLAASGYTLTVALNFKDRRIVGFASSAKDWHPVQGTFEIVT